MDLVTHFKDQQLVNPVQLHTTVAILQLNLNLVSQELTILAKVKLFARLVLPVPIRYFKKLNAMLRLLATK